MLIQSLTEYECYQIVYITMRGWACDDDGNWTKEGKTRTAYNSITRDNEEIDNKFSFDEAFWEEHE